ncbi:MAG: hypothetical protein P8I94_10305, partial [Emcibacteraceae bacterium]|nr:hypothetical protein [Emcibacteraceae bacterium]
KKIKKESFRVNELEKTQYIVCRFVLSHRKNGNFSHSEFRENEKRRSLEGDLFLYNLNYIH